MPRHSKSRAFTSFRIKYGAVQSCCPICLGACRCARLYNKMRFFPKDGRYPAIFGEFVREGKALYYHVSAESDEHDETREYQSFISYVADDLAFVAAS